MGNRSVSLPAAVALLWFCQAACSGNKQTNQLSALDNAYRSGILTQAEYDAKKAALQKQSAALAALDRAFQAGILTNEEYKTKKTALLAPAVGAGSARAAPGNVLSEPQDPKAAAAPSTPASTAAQGHYFRMKLAQTIDREGFERPMPSASMLIPADWQSQGATRWNIKDRCNPIHTTFQASGPDGRAFEVFSEYNWIWADNPTFLQQDFAQKASMGVHGCDVMPPISAADYIRRNLARVRPNARIVALEPLPKYMAMLQQQARQTEQMAAQYQLRQSVRPDLIRARLKYSLNGKPVEEWIVVKTMVTATLGPSFNIATGGMTQAYTYNCNAVAIAERAPEGQLDSSEKLFELLASSIRVNPEWQDRVTQGMLAVQQTELKGARDRSAIISKNAEDIRNIQRQSYENRQRSEDHIFGQFSEATRGVETYRNPASGETIELSNQYGHAWVNNRGEYLLSDQEGFDPNVTFKEEWKPLEPVKP